MKNLDAQLSDKLFFATKSSRVFSKIAIFCAAYLLWMCIAALVVFVAWSQIKTPGQFSWTNFLFLESAVFLRVFIPWIVTMIFSLSIRRKRPFRAEHHKPLIHMPFETPSFPSAHATISFAFATLFIGDMILFPIAIAMAIAVVYGRVAVGVHYISDILAGAVVGLIFGVLVSRFLPLFIGS
ncbi:hypothetical protein A3C09_01285 [Candidatus Uhrbacteria bacterium RIFCSPHIGHO2_02_FULL_47_44]|uniref:Phosphatidic acid phosphatase type 2/haloperoxidase domain-containing protein n=1 Tax=Candidatus Uhrbacteria bacterium RIFCSPLOWO2_02_FULL_48_18 TaxID=1802408 RepID=A0A1F7V8Z3_9BACT|nr:MAG: hypothetical protein A3C09_01285 [Candidatus Uhrbacteria bacterium RIFCSPHIGHO2_02_FULL_47_44]OGL77420.1 MAG: hypothetical protein A3E97_00335 [Candidatus Uhrbacteria bacterium RIFCSPHIGHO2_12_FULL_47_12]OGL81780.1 MAG: hypothetical protein A3B20_01650 [Candidatus Uhrbacteria bacterium RIFCSPLOWO2_01_FULL_47_17]OGL86943.1 MAG: hypothetical protein A3I41_03240 [Candidatus Uhrbacteria bacterium RIFCSPLOWO2_02_FULL_48_18]OGL94342.1 MAG: hypothetical protein A3H12_05090 [Candidatus Uhrbacte